MQIKEIIWGSVFVCIRFNGSYFRSVDIVFRFTHVLLGSPIFLYVFLCLKS